jgi:hypothetical protein
MLGFNMPELNNDRLVHDFLIAGNAQSLVMLLKDELIGCSSVSEIRWVILQNTRNEMLLSNQIKYRICCGGPLHNKNGYFTERFVQAQKDLIVEAINKDSIPIILLFNEGTLMMYMLSPKGTITKASKWNHTDYCTQC